MAKEVVVEEEHWREIDEYPEYSISSYGNVWDEVKQIFVIPHEDRSGLRVNFRPYGNTDKRYIHILVARAFMDDYRPRLQIRQIDEDKGNNWIGNLRPAGKFKQFRINEDQSRADRFIRIVETGEVFPSVRLCAQHIGGNYSNIYRVLNGERHSHLGYTFEWVDQEDE